MRKIWIPITKMGFPSATQLLIKIKFLIEGEFCGILEACEQNFNSAYSNIIKLIATTKLWFQLTFWYLICLCFEIQAYIRMFNFGWDPSPPVYEHCIYQQNKYQYNLKQQRQIDIYSLQIRYVFSMWFNFLQD